MHHVASIGQTELVIPPVTVAFGTIPSIEAVGAHVRIVKVDVAVMEGAK